MLSYLEEDMGNPPTGKSIVCPECNESVMAIVPKGSTIAEREENADGKVRVNCPACGTRFLAYFRFGR